jgi:hypothetical protein
MRFMDRPTGFLAQNLQTGLLKIKRAACSLLGPSGCMEWIFQKAFEAVVSSFVVPALWMVNIDVGPWARVGKPFLDGLDQDGLDQLRHPALDAEERRCCTRCLSPAPL